MAAGNSSTAFHQTACRTGRLHSPSERDEEGGRERRGEEWGMRRGEEDETGGGGGGGGGKGGGPRRQMPPLWPWHCWILIVQSHIVPTLLEM